MRRLLDMFCGQGGAAMGYADAGFDEIVGVDLAAQPRYPFTFVHGDALEYCRLHGHEFDAVHANPPCQVHSVLAHFATPGKHLDLIAETRAALTGTGRPWVIENVPGAPLVAPVMLCGTMFGLGFLDEQGWVMLRRHRLFETNWELVNGGLFGEGPRLECDHSGRRLIGVYGDTPRNPQLYMRRYPHPTVTLSGGTSPKGRTVGITGRAATNARVSIYRASVAHADLHGLHATTKRRPKRDPRDIHRGPGPRGHAHAMGDDGRAISGRSTGIHVLDRQATFESDGRRLKMQNYP